MAAAIEPFLNHPLADLRIAAATAAGEAGDISLEPHLSRLLSDADAGVSKAAWRALEQLSGNNTKAA